MKKSYCSFAVLLLTAFFSIAAHAQSTTVTGNVRNATNKDVIPAVSVMIKGGVAGTFTDEKGNFKLVTNLRPPFTMLISSVGFQSQEIAVNNASDHIQADLVPEATLGVEVVVSASRVPERILESPVSIERVSALNIRNAPAANYYDILRNIKGVDLTYSSLTYATPSTRGFNGSGNARFNQIVDGMDNQAPGLNFSVGSVIGLTELDVDNMELLPGASSALYGPGGMNGTLLINSKNPFKYQGLSFQAKTGVMHVDHKQTNGPTPYYDWAVRWGDKVSERFAFKIGAQFIHATDWIATDESNYQSGNAAFNTYGNVKPGTRTSDPNYDGVNVYGDETNSDLANLFKLGNIINVPGFGPVPARVLFASQAKQAYAARPASAQPVTPAQFNAMVDAFLSNNNGIDTTRPLLVSRTGYKEKEVVNNNTVNVRLSGGLYYKLRENLELSLIGYMGAGNTVYQGSDRYSLRDLKMAQYKLELKNPFWFLRAYTTQENAGESYNATITTRLFNERWKASTQWYPEYAVAFLTSRVFGLDPYNAHQTSRGVADISRPVAGTAPFNDIFDQVRKTPISKGGGLFLDKTDLYAVEGQYNFSDRIKFMELIVGGNWKQYVLNSEGTLFADTAGHIKINELGAYAQVAKSFLKDRVKLSVAGRYDYNENFDPRFTPRITAVVKVVENHNLRFSYQTAYRFPTTQNQWINLVVGGGTYLIGGLPQFRTFYQFDSRPVYSVPNVIQAATAGNPGLLQPVIFGKYKPETVRSFEAGYKGLFAKKLLVDLYGYYSKYNDFLGRRVVVRAKDNTIPSLFKGLQDPNQWQTFSVAVNSQSNVTTYGFGAGIDWLLPRNFSISANVTADRITDVEPGFVTFFNVPKGYRMNVGVANSGFGYLNRFGFNLVMRKQDNFFYESDFRQGDLNGYATFDVQVSYKLPAQRSIIKLGGTNILNKYYKTAFGNPEIGGLYYVSFGYNVF